MVPAQALPGLSRSPSPAAWRTATTVLSPRSLHQHHRLALHPRPAALHQRLDPSTNPLVDEAPDPLEAEEAGGLTDHLVQGGAQVAFEEVKGGVADLLRRELVRLAGSVSGRIRDPEAPVVGGVQAPKPEEICVMDTKSLTLELVHGLERDHRHVKEASPDLGPIVPSPLNTEGLELLNLSWRCRVEEEAPGPYRLVDPEQT